VKAIVYERYGSPDVLRFEDIDTPMIDDDQVLVQIRAAAANPYDWPFTRGEPYFCESLCRAPQPKTSWFWVVTWAREVEAVGDSVSGRQGAVGQCSSSSIRWTAQRVRRPT
jgi:NADPH:quinone reductase-like Zn-dependent oxidoreductase